jgi:hypothetical protein
MRRTGRLGDQAKGRQGEWLKRETRRKNRETVKSEKRTVKSEQSELPLWLPFMLTGKRIIETGNSENGETWPILQSR